ncbi:MAG TPA: sensor domain-containing diguanylate cyclase [Phycisphaerales bacterium]|nr:sensor domain-containing diguanylate cyclase [Phycisphaerales bacterium]
MRQMMEQDDNFDRATSTPDLPMLEQITPLARRVNCLDLDSIAEVCVTDIPRLVGVKFASLYILDDTNNILHLHKHNHPFLINRIVSLNQTPPSPMVMAVQSKQLILISNIDTHQQPVIRKSQRAFAENYQTNNCAIVPLICQENVVGVLNLADKIDRASLTREDIALVELFGQLVGASIGNVKLFERIQRQATTDGLTGLINHKTFYDMLEKELWRSRRYGGKISLIMIDVDGLKGVNDNHGHRAGDKIIREISRRIKDCIRQIDIAARYGGDEFAVILPNTQLSDATVVAERMVAAVAKSPVTWKGKTIHLSISVGLGEYGPDTNPEEVTSKSDQALYAAKHSGKNTVRVFRESE